MRVALVAGISQRNLWNSYSLSLSLSLSGQIFNHKTTLDELLLLLGIATFIQIDFKALFDAFDQQLGESISVITLLVMSFLDTKAL